MTLCPIELSTISDINMIEIEKNESPNKCCWDSMFTDDNPNANSCTYLKTSYTFLVIIELILIKRIIIYRREKKAECYGAFLPQFSRNASSSCKQVWISRKSDHKAFHVGVSEQKKMMKWENKKCPSNLPNIKPNFATSCSNFFLRSSILKISIIITLHCILMILLTTDMKKCISNAVQHAMHV